MGVATNVTVKQINTPGNLSGGPPVVERLTHEGGAFPSRNEAKQQVKEQRSLDATVLAAGPGEGHSRLEHGGSQKKSPAPKAEAKAAEKAGAPAAIEGHQEADKESKAVAKGEEEDPAAGDVEKTKAANAAVVRARAKEKELKEARQRLAELEAAAPKAKEYEELFKNAKKDPIGFLQKAGLDIETIAQAAINGGKRPEELVKLEELEAKIKERDEREAREREEAAQRAQVERVNANIAAHFTEVNQLITSDPEAYEFSHLKMQGEKVPLTVDNGSTFMVEPAIADAWAIQEYAAEALGRLLSPKELAAKLERYYEEEYSQLRSTKKIQKLLGAGDDRPAKKEAPTLGSRKLGATSNAAAVAPMPKLNRKDFRSDKEFLDALVRQADERRKLAKETKAR